MRIVVRPLLFLLAWISVQVNCGILDRSSSSDSKSAKVKVLGDIISHNDLRLLVDTTDHNHDISLTRVKDRVMHEDVQGFLVSEDEAGKTEIHVEKLPEHVLKYTNQFFNNPDTGTIVSIIHGPNGDVHIEGFLGHNLIIAPPGSEERHRRDLHSTHHTVWTNDEEEFSDYLEVPEKFRNEISNRHSKLKKVFKRSSKVSPSLFLDYLEVPKSFQNRYVEFDDVHRKKRQTRKSTPFVIEVFLLVDYKVFQWFNEDISKIGTYLLHFWQAVNYKFRTMTDPDIAVKVTQYGAVQSNQFQSFIENNRLPTDKSLISLSGVLEGFRKWMVTFESNIHFFPHDVAVLMTGEDLCRVNGTSQCFRLTAGIGYVKGACLSSTQYPATYDVAVSEMGKSFKGVLVSAHEVGHLIGAYHDGEKESLACPKDSGFIMSYTRDNATMFTRFSQCSKISIKQFLSHRLASCLQVTSNTGYKYPDILPGQYMPIVDQCFQYSHGYPCPSQPLEERCSKLCCENVFYRVRRREPAVDGTECGSGKVCMNGACVLLSTI